MDFSRLVQRVDVLESARLQKAGDTPEIALLDHVAYLQLAGGQVAHSSITVATTGGPIRTLHGDFVHLLGEVIVAVLGIAYHTGVDLGRLETTAIDGVEMQIRDAGRED